MKNLKFLPALLFLISSYAQAQTGTNIFPAPTGNVGIDATAPLTTNLTIGTNGPNSVTASTVKLRINEHNPFIELNDNSTSGGPMTMANCGIRFTTSPYNTFELKSFSNGLTQQQGMGLFNHAQNFGLSFYNTNKMYIGLTGTSGSPMIWQFGDVNITSDASAPKLTIIQSSVWNQPVLETGYSFGVLGGKSIFKEQVVIGGRVSDFANGFPGTYSLYVKNGILAEKVKVALPSSAAWADYVFDKDYQLMPLKEVNAFIQKNKHLPGVPSATEVFEQGLDVATMDATLLKKVEEMTLYMIQMENRIKELEAQLSSK
ncbi:MAG: hypothetical protein K0R51_2683 [Cytophagaceae bacterium]|jgi:hypothetical protein|nr:hypothetical protein [Cytophagaceae bacterium]